ncbi:hypothetical protein NM688_g4415 [Phlebia brevispora]|uniref:Uncharacterized protein n=1 Tax=Phlebia brevispora TaxID=194682 RepID=A0ACC1T2X2_9APHY|nr:hypothetical protein NM688_g4415 [Phlebia brevispora]
MGPENLLTLRRGIEELFGKIESSTAIDHPDSNRLPRLPGDERLAVSAFMPELLRVASGDSDVDALKQLLTSIFPRPDEYLSAEEVFLRCVSAMEARTRPQVVTPRLAVSSPQAVQRQIHDKSILASRTDRTLSQIRDVHDRLNNVDNTVYDLELRLEEQHDTSEATAARVRRLEKRFNTLSEDQNYVVSDIARSVEELDTTLSSLSIRRRADQAQLRDKYVELENQLADMKLGFDSLHGKVLLPEQDRDASIEKAGSAPSDNLNTCETAAESGRTPLSESFNEDRDDYASEFDEETSSMGNLDVRDHKSLDTNAPVHSPVTLVEEICTAVSENKRLLDLQQMTALDLVKTSDHRSYSMSEAQDSEFDDFGEHRMR